MLLTQVLPFYFVMPSHLSLGLSESPLLLFILAVWEYGLVCILDYLLVLFIRIQGGLRRPPAQFGRINNVHSVSTDLLVLINKVLTK